MQILVVAATEFEIAPFLEKYPAADHLITGVGSAISMYHLAKRIHQIEYDLIIQAGVGGHFSDSCSLAEVVLVSKDRFGDVGITENNQWIDLFDQGLADANEYPFTQGWLVNEKINQFTSTLKKVSAITVNMLTNEWTHINRLNNQFHADVESMEGAALHYVCLQEHIPFIQLRGISNKVGERDKSKWKLQEAIVNLNKELIQVVETMIHPS